MPGLEITLLGDVTIRRAGVPLSCRSTKALELLCYLVTHRDRSHDRTVLSELLWPERELATSKRYLRQAFWKLQTAIQRPAAVPAGEPELVVAPHPGRLQIGPTAIARLDIADLDRLQETGHLRGDELNDQQAAELEQVLTRCTGEFLAGWDPEWCLYERARLEEVRLSGLEQLIQWCESRKLFVKALHLGRLVLAAAPARETTHRLLMRRHHLAGDRSAAVRQFQQCAQALREEYGVAPSPLTVRLHRWICSDDGSAGAAPAQGDPPPPQLGPVTPVAASPVGTAGDDQLRDGALAALQAQLSQIQLALETLTRLVVEHAAPAPHGPLPRQSGEARLSAGLRDR